MKRKIKYACQTCGSEDVTFDATAEWDVEQQKYVVGTIFNDCFCGSDKCAGETTRVQEYDLETGEALSTAPGSFELIPKAEADAAWQAYHQRIAIEREEREKSLKQEAIISSNLEVLSAAVQELM